VSGQATHTAVIKSDGTLWNWGWNFNGQLANGTNSGNYNNNTQNLPIQVSCTPLVIDEFSFNSFQIYPNPSSETIYIKNNLSTQIQNIKIIDFAGKMIYYVNDNLSEINLSKLETGVYFLLITSESKSYKYKLVKM
jgi:hypothetical protein